MNDFSGHHLRLRLAPDDEHTTPEPADALENALTIILSPAEATSATLDPHKAVLDITYPPNAMPSQNSASSPLATYIAKELRSTFEEERATISYLLSTSSMSADVRPRSVSPDIADSLAKRTTRSLRYSATYHLSFSLFTEGALPSTWDVEAGVAKYMQPMLDVLTPIHNFTIDTQV